jgi:hypothetical protein
MAASFFEEIVYRLLDGQRELPAFLVDMLLVCLSVSPEYPRSPPITMFLLEPLDRAKVHLGQVGLLAMH